MTDPRGTKEISDPGTPEGAQALYAALNEDERRELNALHEQVRAYARQTIEVLKKDPNPTMRRGGLASLHTGVATLLESLGRPSYENALAEGIMSPVACDKGCAFCCYLSVETTIPGAIAVANALEGPRANLKSGLADTAPKIAGKTPSQRAAMQVPCPFLRDNACQVYDVRPLSCQSHYSFDKKACETDRASGGVAGNIPVYGLPRVLNTMITGGVCVACEDLGLQSCTVELTAAVSLIISDPTAIARWLAGESVFEPYRP